MCRKDEGVIDESPAAYKNIDNVMESQLDLVDTIHTLKQVLCIKGWVFALINSNAECAFL